jgi:hypothetical protein
MMGSIEDAFKASVKEGSGGDKLMLSVSESLKRRQEWRIADRERRRKEKERKENEETKGQP